jgi:hypothetical protein
MVRRTDPELDCVMKAARPLDVGARDAFLRELAGDERVVHRGVAGFSVDFFAADIASEKLHARAAFGLNRRRIRRRGMAPTLS